jgi:hypothetical protein
MLALWVAPLHPSANIPQFSKQAFGYKRGRVPRLGSSDRVSEARDVAVAGERRSDWGACDAKGIATGRMGW